MPGWFSGNARVSLRLAAHWPPLCFAQAPKGRRSLLPPWSRLASGCGGPLPQAAPLLTRAVPGASSALCVLLPLPSWGREGWAEPQKSVHRGEGEGSPESTVGWFPAPAGLQSPSSCGHPLLGEILLTTRVLRGQATLLGDFERMHIFSSAGE